MLLGALVAARMQPEISPASPFPAGSFAEAAVRPMSTVQRIRRILAEQSAARDDHSSGPASPYVLGIMGGIRASTVYAVWRQDCTPSDRAGQRTVRPE